MWKELEHPNILPFLGVDMTLRRPSCCLISPWMKNGNVLEFIKANPNSDRLALVGTQSGIQRNLNVFKLRDVLEGLRYLHTLNPPVAHGDVKCVCVHIFVCSLSMTKSTA
jgi:serine/threonine protein kinase